MRKSISVILPTFNEKENLEVLVPLVVAELKKISSEWEIIIADDNSPDGTAGAVAKMSAKYYGVRLLNNKMKKGIGFALGKAIQNVRNEIIVTMDADCSINPSEIQLLLNELEKGYDFVVGSKYLGGAFYEKQKFSTKLRSFISESGNRYLSVVSGIPLRDFSLNFRAFTVKVAQSVKPDDYKNFFLVQQIIRANKKGFRITEVPVTFSERKFGSSKTQVWNQAIRFFIGGFEEVFLK